MVEANDVEMQDEEKKIDPVEFAEQKKNEGNAALREGNLDQAIALYTEAIEMNKNEGMFTNRAMAYIKQRKYKEALFDCEQALYLNPQFAKAHLRAYTCNQAQGFLVNAKQSLQSAIDLGDTSQADKMATVDELIKYEGFVKAAFERKEYREAVFYSTRLVENCPDSVKHVKMRIKAAILHNPNDMT